MKKSNEEQRSGFSDILNIQGEDIPDIDDHLDALLKKGLISEQKILDGASDKTFGKRQPYATTKVRIEFERESDLRKCVRLLRWSDERLLAMGSTIAWAWAMTVREGMTIKFAVNWYDKDFFERRKDAFRDSNHLSYFRMFGKGTNDMDIYTEVLGTRLESPQQ